MTARGSDWLGMIDRNTWQNDALCAQVGGDIFHPETGRSAKEAKRVCRVCPVQQACLMWAVDTGQEFGVLGGLSARERKSLSRGRPLTPCVLCGTDFVSRDPGQRKPRRYCSDDCRRAARRRAERAYRERRDAA